MILIGDISFSVPRDRNQLKRKNKRGREAIWANDF